MSTVTSAPKIDSPSVLGELAQLAQAAGRLALDTEFMGEGRYRTLLCLLQLAAPDGVGGARIALIDPLREDFDGSPLARVLADPAVEIVVHAGRQDIALLRRRLQTDVRNVFDTQVAAGFAGMAAQGSYESLLFQTLGLRLAKSASFTRWDARPLSGEQLAYAREDVVHLLELAEELGRRLHARGRLEWARQECESLERANDVRDLDAVFARLPRIRGLSASSQAVARELIQWRELTAERGDRPVQGILADPILVEIAKRRPSTIQQLHEIRGVSQSGLRRRGEEVLETVRRGRERPPEPLEQDARSSPPDPADAPLIALAESLARGRAREAKLAYELVASRADLQAILTAHRERAPEPDVRTLKGWRRELVGAEILALLDGEVSLRVERGELRVERPGARPEAP
ncbi:MAG TPA: HRDC domain-containing protein [Solirubrobacteraceae bacterium]|jgi:ribonuclease D|nr:HRDC domain-containing protein [Solirubrobacteraceae bacterium]